MGRPQNGQVLDGLSPQALEGLCAQSLEDLRSDFEELSSIAEASWHRLRQGMREVRRSRASIHPAPYQEIERGLREQATRYQLQLSELGRLSASAGGLPTRALIDALAAARERHAHLLRARQAVSAALLVATDWHSPSIAHTARSNAGRHTGKVDRHRDDYKRDRHTDAGEFERTWLERFVDDPHHRPLRALLTASGMAAFTTILSHLTADLPSNRPVLAGASIYHECRQLLEREGLGPRLSFLPDGDTDGWLAAIAARRPAAVFVDSICNARGLPMPDISAIIEGLLLSGEPAVLVIDNTALSVTFQPFTLVAPGASLRLVVLESLTKYAQLGLDRTAAGILVAPDQLARALDSWREHLGTNITDLAAHQLPRPDRPLLEGRLRRIGRNAELLASRLSAHAAARDLPLTVAHPGLPNHPAHSVARTLPFQGGLLSLDLRDDSHEARERLLKAALYEARGMGVSLCEGTSFGFDTTRIYLTANGTESGFPFLRIAAGSEHRLEVERLAGALTAALDHLQ